MILDRLSFNYKGKPLIERVKIQPPFRYKAVFQNDGCFIYAKGASSKFMSSESSTIKENDEAVLLKCGAYLVDWIIETEHPVEVVAIHLYPELLSEMYPTELPNVSPAPNDCRQVKKIVPDILIAKFMESMEFYFDNPELVNEELLTLKLKELVLLLLQSSEAASINTFLSTLNSPRVANLKKVIDLHKYEQLSIDELADLCHQSPSSFKRKFQATFNDSPISYLNKQKISKAKELLRLSHLSISDISFEIGFQDPLYFTRVFKKLVGDSPSAYRKAYGLNIH